jgi:hypothetical protein
MRFQEIFILRINHHLRILAIHCRGVRFLFQRSVVVFRRQSPPRSIAPAALLSLPSKPSFFPSFDSTPEPNSKMQLSLPACRQSSVTPCRLGNALPLVILSGRQAGKAGCKNG